MCGGVAGHGSASQILLGFPRKSSRVRQNNGRPMVIIKQQPDLSFFEADQGTVTGFILETTVDEPPDIVVVQFKQINKVYKDCTVLNMMEMQPNWPMQCWTVTRLVDSLEWPISCGPKSNCHPTDETVNLHTAGLGIPSSFAGKMFAFMGKSWQQRTAASIAPIRGGKSGSCLLKL